MHTFTRRAAQEMLSRVERLVGSEGRTVHGGTFHSTAHRLLRRFGPHAGIAADFTIMDQGDAEDLMALSRSSLGFADRKKRFPKKETLHHVYSRHVNTEIPVTALLGQEYPQFAEHEEAFARIFADYTTRKQDRNLVDYDDLLLFWAMLVGEAGQASGLATRIAGLYDHVLVDEYQDTNVLQARILEGMAKAHGNLTVVGDDAQFVLAIPAQFHRCGSSRFVGFHGQASRCSDVDRDGIVRTCGGGNNCPVRGPNVLCACANRHGRGHPPRVHALP
mgnify:CR=1 FL=1